MHVMVVGSIGRPAHMVGREKAHVVVLSESEVWGLGVRGGWWGGCDVGAAKRAEDTALILAARKGHSSIVEALLAAGASVDTQDSKGAAPAHQGKAFAGQLGWCACAPATHQRICSSAACAARPPPWQCMRWGLVAHTPTHACGHEGVRLCVWVW